MQKVGVHPWSPWGHTSTSTVVSPPPPPPTSPVLLASAEPPWAVGLGVLDGHHVMDDMLSLFLTRGAEVEIGTNQAFVADAIDGGIAGVTNHADMQRTFLLLRRVLAGALRLLICASTFFHLLFLFVVTSRLLQRLTLRSTNRRWLAVEIVWFLPLWIKYIQMIL